MDKIAELTLQTSGFNSNDILVNATTDQCLAIAAETTTVVLENVRDIVRKAQALIKEAGVNPLCKAEGLLTLVRNGKTQHIPLLITPVAFQIDRIRGMVNLLIDTDEKLLNPYLARLLRETFEVEPAFTNDLEALCDQLEALGFSGIDRSYCVLGNFHPHRYDILKELDELASVNERSHALDLLLGNAPKAPLKKYALGNDLLFAADSDHRSAFRHFEDSDIVIQGPPGTGKSQLLTNFIGKSTKSGLSVLAISEKRSALEVIYQKLNAVGLGDLGFIATPDLTTRDFLQSLRKSWDLFERRSFQQPSAPCVRKELEDSLQFLLDVLNQPELIGGISYGQFRAMQLKYSTQNAQYRPNVPSLSLLETFAGDLERICNANLGHIAGSIRASVYQTQSLESLAEQLDELIAFARQLQQAGVASWKELERIARKSLVCQLFENEISRCYAPLLRPDTRAQQQFLKQSKRYLQLSDVVRKRAPGSEWKTVPSELEAATLYTAIQTAGFWKRRAVTKRWKMLSYLAVEYAGESIEKLQEYYVASNQLEKAREQLTRLGVCDPDVEIKQIQQAIALFTPEKWYIYDHTPLSEREEIMALSKGIERFKTLFKHFFLPEDKLLLTDFLTSVQGTMDQLLVELPTLRQLDIACLDTLRKHPDFDTFMGTVLHSHFVHFCQHYPQLSNFSTEALSTKIEQLLQEQQREQSILSAEILYRRSQLFQEYQQLLVQPVHKLTSEQKEFRKTLRKGKSILVKEFSKTRNFPSLRQLVASEARHWIQLLKPIWLTNPVQLAKSFPMEANLFDLCIFDEASQIPLQNALGAVQRSSRIIVAGDDQQMGPTSYFQTGSSDTTSLLQQSNYYLKPIFLRHHYRSRYPELIAFSNKHFYGDQLMVFPSFPVQAAIGHHFSAEGVFEDRRNVPEAQAVSELLKTIIHEQRTIGIVAFSQEQVDCIRTCLDPQTSQLLEERMDANTAFLKPLEKVQGDECEHLVVSMAYGYDRNGQFALRFGPLNTLQGRNRLNVLFSRASERIDFFSSVAAADFKLSDNESVNLLREWLYFCSVPHTHQEPVFPYQLCPQINGNELILSGIYVHIPSAVELSTVYQLLKQRGWEVVLTD